MDILSRIFLSITVLLFLNQYLLLKGRRARSRDAVKFAKPSKPTAKKCYSENIKTKETKIIKKIAVGRKDKELEATMKVVPGEEDHSEGQFQLNELTTRVLEDELQDIMIEVWRALPDDSPNAVEKHVTEMLRCEASDDFRNVLGLNVSKRLLNVFNPLYVKLHFTNRPESGFLTEFLNKYQVKTFRRIDRLNSKNTFLACVSTISNFDEICTTKEIQCGSAKVTIAPCYNFIKCPSKLTTTFANAKDNKDVEEKILYEDLIQENFTDPPKINRDNEKPNVTDDKPAPEKKAVVEIIKKHVPPAGIEKSVNEKKGQAEVVKKSISTTNVEPNKKTTSENKTDVQKVNKPILDKKTTVEIKSPADAKKSVNEKKAVAEVVKKPSSGTNVVPNNKMHPDNKTDVQKLQKSVPEKKNIVEKKSPADAKKAMNEKKPDAEVVKKPTSGTNVTPKKKSTPENIKAIYKVKAKFETNDIDDDNEMFGDEIEEYEDDDEMNDEEILALISGGVVIDECSGSDVE